MAHDLATADNGQYAFVSFREHAWHRLGTVFQEPKTAGEAWQEIAYRVETIPYLYDTEPQMPSDQLAICRIGANGLPKARFGTVSKHYTLVKPEDYCYAWDIAGATGVKPWPIETMGALGKGEKLFVLSKMPTIAICGDEVVPYVLGVNDMTGKNGNELAIVHVRVVCANTLKTALATAAQRVVINHKSDVIKQMVTVIQDFLAVAEAKSTAVAEALSLLGQHVLTKNEETQALKVAVPITKQPPSSGSYLYDAERLEKWEQSQAVAIARRDTIRSLYEGAAAGYDGPYFRGTAWGLYNATVEAMYHHIPSRGENDMARVAVDGWRADAKEHVFKYLLTVSKN